MRPKFRRSGTKSAVLRLTLPLAALVLKLTSASSAAEIAVPTYESAYVAPASGGPLEDRLFFIQTGLASAGAARLAPPLRVESASRFSQFAPEIALGFIRRKALSSAWEGRASWGASWFALERSESGSFSSSASRTQLLGILGFPLSASILWRGWQAVQPFASLGIRPSMVLSPRSVIAERVSENHLDASVGAGASLPLGGIFEALGSSELQLDWTWRRDLAASASIDLSSGRWMATLALPWE